MEVVIKERKVNTCEDLVRHISDAVIRNNNRDTLRRLKRSVGKRPRMYIEAEGGHFQHFIA
jgi:hypothetical protein